MDAWLAMSAGMQYINIDHLAPDDEEVETPHCSDWAHIAVHYMKGRLIPKSNPYYGEIYYLLVRAYDNVRMHAVACSCICVHANTIVSAYAFIRLHSTASTGGHPPRALDRANGAARRHPHTVFSVWFQKVSRVSITCTNFFRFTTDTLER